MTIAYMDPFSRAWERMKKALFHPFSLGKWMVVGFSAFLAGLMDGKGGNWHSSFSKHTENFDPQDILDFPKRAIQWMNDHPEWLFLILFILFFLLALGVLLTWISSRGKFIFLDNVVHDRAAIVAPWHRFRALGDSLFMWRLCFGLIGLAGTIAILVLGFKTFGHYYRHGMGIAALVLPLMGIVLLFLAWALIAGYILLFLDGFVIPLMYKHNLPVMEAWERFLPLLKEHFVYFLVYGLLVLALHLLIGFCVIFIGCVTCCVGFVIMMIPYISSVILLPVSYFFRCFSLEFLRQFGPECTLWERPEAFSPEPPPIPPAGPGSTAV